MSEAPTAPTMTPAELAAKVAAHIRAHPEQHDQSTWLQNSGGIAAELDLGECGTQACVAGWAVLLHDGRAYAPEVARRAAELLGLIDRPRLFWHDTPRERVLGALDRIARGEPTEDTR